MMALVRAELDRLTPERWQRLGNFLHELRAATLGWDYERQDDRLLVWLIGVDTRREVALAYSDVGFGPNFPWGYVFHPDDSYGSECAVS